MIKLINKEFFQWLLLWMTLNCFPNCFNYAHRRISAIAW
jgi:hypothetical protein